MSELATSKEELLDCRCSDITTGNLVYIRYPDTYKVAFYVCADNGFYLKSSTEKILCENYEKIIRIQNCRERQTFVSALVYSDRKKSNQKNITTNTNSSDKPNGQFLFDEASFELQQKVFEEFFYPKDLENYYEIERLIKRYIPKENLLDNLPSQANEGFQPLNKKYITRFYDPFLTINREKNRKNYLIYIIFKDRRGLDNAHEYDVLYKILDNEKDAKTIKSKLDEARIESKILISTKKEVDKIIDKRDNSIFKHDTVFEIWEDDGFFGLWATIVDTIDEVVEYFENNMNKKFLVREIAKGFW